MSISAVDDGANWAQSNRIPPLQAGVVHVWRVDLDRADLSAASSAAGLAPDEAERAARFRFPRDRQRFVAGRVMLRRLLGEYLGRSPETLRFDYGPNGKPALARDLGDADLTFNLANSDGWALIACTLDRPLGVDLEAIRPIPDLDGLARQCLTPAELVAWRALPSPDQLAAFYRIWARKESYLKARGGGLSISLTATHVTFDPHPTPRMLDLRDLPAAERHYSSVDLAAVPGYASALTVAGPADWTYLALDWPPEAFARS
jgi:4'-phosphopantetheinyl transferase